MLRRPAGALRQHRSLNELRRASGEPHKTESTTRTGWGLPVPADQDEKRTMSTLGAIAKNKKRKALVDKYKAKRDELRKMVKNEKLAPEVRDEAMKTLTELPRNSSATRIRNRCALTGRPRGYYRKFGLSRIALRDMALRGELPGVIKASW